MLSLKKKTFKIIVHFHSSMNKKSITYFKIIYRKIF